MRQHNPPHPGEFIRQVYLEPYAGKISRSEIARRLGVARPTFNRLVNEQSNVSPEMAIRLSKVLGGSAQSWLNTQSQYDLYHAEKVARLNKLQKLDFDRLSA
jgi:addiction module HigA family antidote